MATDPTDLINNLLSGAYYRAGQEQANAVQDRPLQQQAAQQQLQMGAWQLASAQQQFQQQAQQQAAAKQAWATYQADPTHENLTRVAWAAPQQAESLYKGAALLDEDQRQNQTTINGQLYNLADSGSTDQLASQINQLMTAEQKAGKDTSDAQAILDDLKSGDPKRIAAAHTSVKALSRVNLSVLGAKGFQIDPSPSEGSYTLAPGDVRYDGGNNIVARGAPKSIEPFHYTAKDAAGNEHEYLYDPGQASGGTRAAASGPFDAKQFFHDFVLPHEGGYAPHDANGAPVNMGINQSANPGVDVRNLTKDQAADIFATKYAAKAANLPAPLAAAYADTAYINPGRADQFLQASGGDVNKFLTMRRSWQNSLVANQPGKYGPYAKAWATRNADLANYVQGAAPGGATGTIPGSRQIDPNPVNNSGSADVPGDPNKQGNDYLMTLPGGIRGTVKAIANGQMAQPSSFALTKPYWQQVMAAVSQYDPTFDSSTQPQRVAAAKAFSGNGKAAQTVASIDRLSYHLNDLYRDSQALTGWNLGPASGMFNAGVQSFQKAAVARYNAALPFIAGELQKLTKNGSATEGESRQIMANLAPTQPASARLAGMQQLAELTQGQFKPIRDQWSSAYPDGRPMPMDVSPETNAILDAVSGDKGPVAIDPHTGRLAGGSRSQPAQAPHAMVRVTSVAQASALPVGTRYVRPDGKVMVR